MILSKAHERRIRAAIRAVHEKRLAESLSEVEEALKQWRDGSIAVFEVDAAILKHTERARKFFIHYANTAASAPEAIGVLDEAMALGLLTREQYAELTTLKKA